MTVDKLISCLLLSSALVLPANAEGYVNPYRVPQQAMPHYIYAPTHFRMLGPASTVGGLTLTAGSGLQSTTNPASTILPSRSLYARPGMRLGTMSQVVSERPELIAPQHGWLLPDGRFIPEHKPAVTSESVSSGHHYPKSHFVIINPKGRLSACSGAATCEYSRRF